MKNPLRKIRAVSLAVIVGGLVVLGGTPEPAAAWNCQFCVTQCPADVEQFCEERFCEYYGAACMWIGRPATCYAWQVNCNLI